MKKFIYTALALCFTLTITAQVSFQRLYDVVQDSTHVLSDGIATNNGGFATLGSNIVVENQLGIIHRAIFTTYDDKGGVQIAKDIYLADSTRLLSTSELVQVENGSFVLSANLDETDLSACIVALDGSTAEPIWSRRMADEFQLKVSLSEMPGNEVIAGSTNLQEGLSIWLTRINATNGSDIWAKEFVAIDDLSEDVPADLFDLHVSTIDSSIIMTGQSVVEGGTILGYHTTKMDREGNVIWSRHIQSAPAGLGFQPLGVTEATDTSVYVTGRLVFNDGVTVLNNLFVTKYDTEGAVVWVKTLTGSNSTFSNGNDIVSFGDNLVVSTLGTETGLETVSGMIELDTSGVILNSQVYRDTMTLFSLSGGLSTTNDDGLAMFTTRFEQPFGFVSDIVKTGSDLTTPCSSSGSGILEDVPYRSQSLGWVVTDFVDSDTLETDIKNVNYYNVPTISPTTMPWCPNEQILDTLDATPSPLPNGVISYEWKGPGVDGNTNPFVVGMEEGEYMVTVTINDKHCYTLCDTVNIMRLQEPVAGIEADYSQFCSEGIVVLSGQAVGVTPFQSIVWSTGQTEGSIAVEQEGNYTFTVVDDCIETATATEEVVFPEANDLQWPKVFFPNGEEDVNRSFGPYIDEECDLDVSNYTLKIYNRWGNEVFTSDNLSLEWNGQHGGSDSASAVYVWVAQYSIETLNNGELQTRKGDVTLLR